MDSMYPVSGYHVYTVSLYPVGDLFSPIFLHFVTERDEGAHRDTDSERDRETHTQRQKGTQREMQKQREIERAKEREKHNI